MMNGSFGGIEPKIIAVDFDGTLFTNKYPNIGEPIWKTINFCKEEQQQGSIIILWTCRHGDDLTVAIDACNKVGLRFNYVNRNAQENLDRYDGIDNRKIFAHLYIDDRAIRPEEI